MKVNYVEHGLQTLNLLAMKSIPLWYFTFHVVKMKYIKHVLVTNLILLLR